MKKMFLFLCLSAALSVLAADSPKPAPKTPTVWELVNSPIARKVDPLLKSVKMEFQLSGKDMPKRLLMLRVNRGTQFRLDSLSEEGSYAMGGTPEKFWCWNTKEGEFKLTEEELDELQGDLGLLPIPFLKREIFTAPVFEKTEYVQGRLCNCWKTTDKDATFKIRLWIDQKDSLLRKVETESNGKIQIFLYENYQIFNGVEMASTIRQIDNTGNVCTMELKSLQWNVKFARKIFDLPKKGELLTLEKQLLRKNRPAPQVQKQSAAVIKVVPQKNSYRKTQLERRIARLEIEISAMEDQQKKMEKAYSINRQDSNNLASDIGHSGSYRWYGNGFRYTRGYTTSGRTSTMKRQVRTMERQNRAIEKEYDKIRRQLVEKKIELSNAKIDLKNLME